jgi:phosphatidylglycerol:prolipoprotein diacylglycerol transferase
MHPVLFELGGVKIFSYGLLMLAGYGAALIFILRFARRAGFCPGDAFDLSIYAFISGIAGARALHLLINSRHYLASPWWEVFNLQGGGLAWHGGLIGGILCIYAYCRVKNHPAGQGMDLIFTPSLLGLGMGRIGCFLNGCCYGKESALPWAVQFPRMPHPVHPTQLYEMTLDFAIFAFLVYWWDRRKFAGENTLLSFALYSLARFVVETFRVNSPGLMLAGLSVAQWASVVIFAALMTAVAVGRARGGGAVTESQAPEG